MDGSGSGRWQAPRCKTGIQQWRQTATTTPARRIRNRAPMHEVADQILVLTSLFTHRCWEGRPELNPRLFLHRRWEVRPEFDLPLFPYLNGEAAGKHTMVDICLFPVVLARSSSSMPCILFRRHLNSSPGHVSPAVHSSVGSVQFRGHRRSFHALLFTRLPTRASVSGSLRTLRRHRASSPSDAPCGPRPWSSSPFSAMMAGALFQVALPCRMVRASGWGWPSRPGL